MTLNFCVVAAHQRMSDDRRAQFIVNAGQLSLAHDVASEDRIVALLIRKRPEHGFTEHSDIASNRPYDQQTASRDC